MNSIENTKVVSPLFKAEHNVSPSEYSKLGQFKKLQVEIPQQMHNQFKAQCFMRGSDMKNVILQLVSAWLQQCKEKNKE